MASMMRAAVLSHPGPAVGGPLEFVERPVPEPEVGEVRIAVRACALCRTDLQLCDGHLQAHRLPIIPGHQIVGSVDALGPGVTGVRVGDRVGVAWIAGTCGHCRFCAAGRENLCEEATFTGWHRDGGFAEALVARADFTYRLPDAFDDIASAPLLCGGAIGLRSLRVCGIEPGGRLGLYGFGASATCTIQIARHWDCEVFVCTRSPDEQQRALDLGAVWAGDYDQKPPAPLDAAITFAPVGSVVIKALQALDKGGVVAINAIHLDEVPAFSYDDLWWERQIRSVANVTRGDIVDLIELAAALPIRTRVEEIRLEDANEALARLAAGDTAGTAVLDVAAR